MNTEIIDHKTIRLPINYVLIKPDDDFKFLHNENGEETGIYVATSLMQYKNPNSEYDYTETEVVETLAQNLSYSGTVIQIPEKLIFNGRLCQQFFNDNKDILEGVYENDTDNQHSVEKRKKAMYTSRVLQDMREESVEYEVPIEVKIGDRIFYDFTEKFDSKIIKTDIGELFLIKYDKLETVIRGEEVYPLNDNILVEWENNSKIKFGSLELEGPKKKIYEVKGVQTARIVGLPCQVTGCINPNDHVDISDLNIGDEVYFLPQYAFYLENENHYILFGGREILRIKSKDVLFKKM